MINTGRTKGRRNNFQRLSVEAALRSSRPGHQYHHHNGEPEPERKARACQWSQPEGIGGN